MRNAGSGGGVDAPAAGQVQAQAAAGCGGCAGLVSVASSTSASGAVRVRVVGGTVGRDLFRPKAGLVRKPRYFPAVRANGPVSRQVGSCEDNSPKSDLRTQARQAFANQNTVLQAAG